MKFTITGDTIIKKNHRPIYINRATGKRFLGKSKRLSDYETWAVTCLKEGIVEYWEGMISGELPGFKLFPIKEPIQITYKFYCKTKRRVDVSNLIEAPQDCLVKADIISDDSIIERIIAEKFYDKKNPRCVLFIELIGDKND